MSNARNLANLLSPGASTLASAAIADDAITAAKIDDDGTGFTVGDLTVGGTLTSSGDSIGNNVNRMLLDASASGTDVGENFLLDASASGTDVGGSILFEVGTGGAGEFVQTGTVLQVVRKQNRVQIARTGSGFETIMTAEITPRSVHSRIMIFSRVSAHIDGGMWANNPSAIALASARSIFGDHHNFLVVSFGTGESKQPYSYEETGRWGKLKWGAHAVEIFRDGQMQAVDRQMKYENNAAYIQIQTDMDQRDGDPRVDDVLDAASDANRQALLVRGERMKEEHQRTLNMLEYYMKTTPIQDFDALLEETQEKNKDYRPRKDVLFDQIRKLSAEKPTKKQDQPEISP